VVEGGDDPLERVVDLTHRRLPVAGHLSLERHHDLEEQLMNRDEEIATLREHRLHAEDSLRRAVDALEEKLNAVEPTLLWRLGLRYWSLKQLIRETLRRGSS